MRTTTYWKAKCLDDHDCYSLRAETKKDVERMLKDNGCVRGHNFDGQACWVERESNYPRFALPEKVQINYTSRIDLIRQLRGEEACDL